MQALREKLDGVSENLTTVNSDVSGLKRLKVSGYLQAWYDFWDPNVHGDYADWSPKKKDDATGTMSLAVHYFWDSWVRIRAVYDMPRLLKDVSLVSKSPYDPKDNRFTLQFQFTI